MDEPREQITRLLGEVGDRPAATSELLDLVYDQLHAMANARMRNERAGHTLQATVLVHEAFLRLVEQERVNWANRRHFFRVAAECMRRLLIDHARQRQAVKRGGQSRPLPLNVVDLAVDYDPAQVLALEEALATLEQEDPRAAEVVKLRFFAGLTVEETVQAMEISERTIMREWAFARARLYELLADRERDEAG